MPLVNVTILMSSYLFLFGQGQSTIVHIPTSKAISIAQMIARNEGYNIDNDRIYFFDLLTTSGGRPLVRGYTSIGFYINGNIRSTISIHEATGQAIDMNSCEIFDYPAVRTFQSEMLRLSKAKKRTAQELADDVGCSSPKLLSKPIAIKRASRRSAAIWRLMVERVDKWRGL